MQPINLGTGNSADFTKPLHSLRAAGWVLGDGPCNTVNGDSSTSTKIMIASTNCQHRCGSGGCWYLQATQDVIDLLISACPATTVVYYTCGLGCVCGGCAFTPFLFVPQFGVFEAHPASAILHAVCAVSSACKFVACTRAGEVYEVAKDRYILHSSLKAWSRNLHQNPRRSPRAILNSLHTPFRVPPFSAQHPTTTAGAFFC